MAFDLSVAISAAIGAAGGGGIVAWFTWLLNERTRKMDLYKVVYPERIKAVQGIMELAQQSYTAIRCVELTVSWDAIIGLHPDATRVVPIKHVGERVERKTKSDIGYDLAHLLIYAKVYGWQSSTALLSAVEEFGEQGLAELGDETGTNKTALESATDEAYKVLCDAARAEMHLVEFENLFPSIDKQAHRAKAIKSKRAKHDKQVAAKRRS